MELLITRIRELVQVESGASLKKRVRGRDMGELPSIQDAYIWIRDGRIAGFGPMKDLMDPSGSWERIPRLEAEGRLVLPCWCDSHTHLVFAGSRESELLERIRGMSYSQIAGRGGGILSSARSLEQASPGLLLELALERLETLRRWGTGAVEIKSGYGLSLEGELKMLRVIRDLKSLSPLSLRATFLGAHAFPEPFRQDHPGYIRMLTEECLPVIAGEGLADYIDVYCEEGFFSLGETEDILEAGLARGLRVKLHANQWHSSGGVQIGVKFGALSVDHLEAIGVEEIGCLRQSDTLATLLPGASFFLGQKPAPARSLLEADIPVAIATDFNPGTCPCGNMNFMLSLACIQLKMTPQEAVHASTLNGAAAMDYTNSLGSIAVGKKANLILTRPVPSLNYLPYSFAGDLVERVMIDGKW